MFSFLSSSTKKIGSKEKESSAAVAAGGATTTTTTTTPRSHTSIGLGHMQERLDDIREQLHDVYETFTPHIQTFEAIREELGTMPVEIPAPVHYPPAPSFTVDCFDFTADSDESEGGTPPQTPLPMLPPMSALGLEEEESSTAPQPARPPTPPPHTHIPAMDSLLLRA